MMYPPNLPDFLRVFWASLVTGVDLTDDTYMIGMIQALASEEDGSLPDEARLWLIEGMLWKRRHDLMWGWVDKMAAKTPAEYETEDEARLWARRYVWGTWPR